MATYDSIRTINRVADAAAIRPYRYVVFNPVTGLYGECGVAQGEADGIAAEGVAAGEVFPMVPPDNCIAKIEAGALIAVGAVLATDNQGRAITAVSGAGNFELGKALQGAAAAGEIIEIQFYKDRDQA